MENNVQKSIRQGMDELCITVLGMSWAEYKVCAEGERPVIAGISDRVRDSMVDLCRTYYGE